MKTLYISDLDGTLLNSNAELSEYSIDKLNYLIDQGICFTVATARTAATVIQMLRRVHINIPIVLMNGVAVYDIAVGEYVKVNYIQESSVRHLIQCLKKHHRSGFLYSIKDGELQTCYEKSDSDHAKRFIAERQLKFKKKFTQIPDFSLLSMEDKVYFSICDREEKLSDLYRDLQEDEGLHVEFYKDVYEQEYWYLEVCSAEASKYGAVQYLRLKYGFDKVVCFGDNLNDLPMFRASDRGYAVENARDEVKNAAAGIIEGNDADGVVRWLCGQISLQIENK